MLDARAVFHDLQDVAEGIEEQLEVVHIPSCRLGEKQRPSCRGSCKYFVFFWLYSKLMSAMKSAEDADEKGKMLMKECDLEVGRMREKKN